MVYDVRIQLGFDALLRIIIIQVVQSLIEFVRFPLFLLISSIEVRNDAGNGTHQVCKEHDSQELNDDGEDHFYVTGRRDVSIANCSEGGDDSVQTCYILPIRRREL